LPRYASITCGSRRTTSGAPRAITLPNSSTTTSSQMPSTRPMSWSMSSIAWPPSTSPRSLRPTPPLSCVSGPAAGPSRQTPRARRVEADGARLCDERARDADELALALRQLARQHLGDPLESHQRERRVDLLGAAVWHGHRFLHGLHDGRAVRRDEQVLAHAEI